MRIQEYLAKKKIICDGAFGTYYETVFGDKLLPEQANLLFPDRVKQIHKEYLDAGAVLLRTNTFLANRESLACEREELERNLKAAYRCAEMAAEETGRIPGEDCFIAGDIGPLQGSANLQESEVTEEYRWITNALLEAGAAVVVFETLTDIDIILPVIRELKVKRPDVFIIVQFCVNQQGYSNAGLSADRLIEEAGKIKEIDAVGLNCGVGPAHLYSILEKIRFPEEKYITALPNAGYAKLIKNRMVFHDNTAYFSEKMNKIAMLGIQILGGCCGTTPEYIRQLEKTVDLHHDRMISHEGKEECLHRPIPAADHSFFAQKEAGRPLIAVELSPPPGADDRKVMEASYYLKNKGVDVVTFPDSPSGRTRADSVLMSLKASQETGLCVMPHICCRDKNAIAIRAQLFGAYINGIRNMLIMTGDPVPTVIRQDVKSVFNFDSIGLMKIIDELNQQEFAEDPICFGGALNHNRINLETEIERMHKKMAQGASFFLTQPVFSKEEAERLRMMKQRTGARILCGIMPLVSFKNALFIKNEIAGISVTDEILARFHVQMSREEGESAGAEIAREVMAFTEDFVDGYYFSIPFNRVEMLKKILFL